MLDEKHIFILLKESLKNYTNNLEKNDFNYMEYKGEIIAYLKVLNRPDIQNKFKYLDINKAKELLEYIENI